jgi:NADH:ubiquinone reductase (non-electrogenic)
MNGGKKHLVILGTGFASFSLVKHIDTELYDVKIVSPRNHFLFTPLLPSTTVGTIEFRSIIEPVRAARKNIEFYLAYCTALETETKIIHCEDALDGRKFSLPFDILIIGVGAISNTFGIAGVNEYALHLKELADARAIRQRIIENFERANTPTIPYNERRRLLHFVVAGGGPTGVEFAAELHDFLTEDLLHSYPSCIPDVTITLLEAANNILTAFDATLADYAMKLFRRQRISVRTHTPVVTVEAEHLILKDGSRVPYGLLVWSTGNAPTPFIQSLPFAKDPGSRIFTDEQFHVKGFDNIFAVGDCATIENFPLLATAQVAQQGGQYLARLLNRSGMGKPVHNFRYRHRGMLAYIGSRHALADLPQFKGHGFSTWIFWRSAYLTKLVSMKNKILVVFDWLKAFVFGRDTSRF